MQVVRGAVVLSGSGRMRRYPFGTALPFKAKQDHAEAQFRLGELYARGEIVDLDLPEAIRWLRSAAVNQHETAVVLLRELTD